MDVLSSLLGGESLLDIFSKTINGWFGGLVTEAFEKFDELMVGLLTGVFHFERLIISGATTVLTDESIRSVYLFLYLLVCSLVVLKFLFKGLPLNSLMSRQFNELLGVPYHSLLLTSSNLRLVII